MNYYKAKQIVKKYYNEEVDRYSMYEAMIDYVDKDVPMDDAIWEITKWTMIKEMRDRLINCYKELREVR